MDIKLLPTDRDGNEYQISVDNNRIEVFFSDTTLVKLPKSIPEEIFSKLYTLAEEKKCSKIEVGSEFIYDSSDQKLTKIGLTNNLIF